MIYGLVDRPLIFTLDDLKRMPRVNRAHSANAGEFRHGMARRAAQRRAVRPRYGALRDVHRRTAEDAAAGSRHQAQREVATDGGRRRRGDDAITAATEGARRCAGGVSHERRDALPGERLSRPYGAAGSGGQHVGQVAAPHRDRRSALAPPRGDVEIHSCQRTARHDALPT